MAEFLLSGHLLDVILALLALEALALFGLAPRVDWLPKIQIAHRAQLWPTLLSGALLMLAVRLALSDADWRILAGVLALAGLTHAVDLMIRFQLAADD